MASRSIQPNSCRRADIIDNTRAKFDLNWRPRTDLAKLIDAAWTYKRGPDDPRKVWYPG
jgi:UDP-glucose 4-epimerase